MLLESIIPRSEQYLFDWNHDSYPKARLKSYKKVVFNAHDETPRDGCTQATYAHGFTDDDDMVLYYAKILKELKITSANAGFISPKEEHQRIIRRTAKIVNENELDIKLTCAVRMVPEDIQSLIQISRETDFTFEAGMFINSILVSDKVLGTSYHQQLDLIKRCIGLAREGEQEVMFILEDGSRTKPEKLYEVNETAIEAGATRLCVTDTVGYFTPDGASRQVNFYQKDIVRGRELPIDFHAHNDRGWAMPNALTAYRAGIDRAHLTWFGIGERNGNISLEQVMVNLALEGTPIDPDALQSIGANKSYVAEMFGYPIAPNLPISGDASHTTGTGVHTSLMLMEEQGRIKGGVGDLIYKPYHAAMVGEKDRFVLNRSSGRSTVTFVLEQLRQTYPHCEDIDPDCSDLLKDALVAYAAKINRTPSDAEVVGTYRRFSKLEQFSPQTLEAKNLTNRKTS